MTPFVARRILRCALAAQGSLDNHAPVATGSGTQALAGIRTGYDFVDVIVPILAMKFPITIQRERDGRPVVIKAGYQRFRQGVYVAIGRVHRF